MLALQGKAFLKSSLVAILVTVLGATLLWQSQQDHLNLVAIESLDNSPDYFITNITVKTFGANGDLIESINSKRASHFNHNLETLLDTPNVKRYSKTGSWTASADTGVLHDGNNDILFMGNALVTKTYLDSDDITLQADQVHYLDREQSLTSYNNAKLISAQGETSAKKITTYINSEKVVMTELVRGYYEASN